MKEMYLFFFILIHYLIKAAIITPITVGLGELTNLNTATNDDTYFYMTVNPGKYGVLFFYLSDSNYNLLEVKVHLTRDFPKSTTIDKNKFSVSKPYKEKVDKDPKEFYYKYAIGEEYYGGEKYLLVYYSGKNSAGTLKARSSFDDLYSLNNAKLSSLHIILIVAGCIIFIGILSTVLVCICKKRKENYDIGGIDARPLVRDTTTSTTSRNLMTIN